ncbi:MAG: molecular chaperone TorD family protein [bacterium]|mgnify:FL=1
MKPNRFQVLAALLSYPGDGYAEAAGLLEREHRSAVDGGVAKFAEFVRRTPLPELEEAFSGTFDVNPACALDVGWHLFGEDYNRGLFLARIRREMARHGLAESAELPDHLTQVLALLDRMDSREGTAFAVSCVLPAVEKMRGKLAEKGSPFEPVLGEVEAVLRERFSPPGVAASAGGAGGAR